MYFFVSFSQQGDEVIIKKAENLEFDLENYKEKHMPGLLSSILKKDSQISKKSISESIGEYLIEYGYNRTYNLMMNFDNKAEEPWLATKEEIRKQLIANNFEIALQTIKRAKKYIRNKQHILRTVRLLQLVYIIRKGGDLKAVFNFMSQALTKFKADKFEMMNRAGTVEEVDLKVTYLD